MLENPHKRLIKYGFIRPKYADKYSEYTTPGEREEKLRSVSEDDAKQHADVEWAEELKEVYMPTEYPNPVKRFWLVFETHNLAIEEMYYWLHHNLKVEGSMEIEKILDNYAASEGSSFFGLMQQRLSIQQGNISNFLKGISEMVKGLFQIVREIRILNDRLQYYLDTYEQNENANSSEIVLKGLWVDQVEGGTKNPSSVYGLAATVGFSILPDVFFRIKLKDTKEVEKAVEALQFNEKVKEVLKRKLRQYYEWKIRTFKELETRKRFELKYLRQHYETINLYISWVKPYLRYTRRMQQLAKLEEDSRIIKSFESAFIEIEVLAIKKGKVYNQVIIFNFQFRSRPETLIHQPHEYGQKGPIHIGRAEAKLRVYAWTKDQIKNYKDYKKEDDIALLSSIDETIKEAMHALGDELFNFLGVEGEKFGDNKKINDLAEKLVASGVCSSMDEAILKAKDLKSAKNKKKSELTNAIDPFISIFKGFEEIFKAFGMKDLIGTKSKKNDDPEIDKEKKEAKKDATKTAYNAYKNYKKAHKMLSW